MAVRGRRSFEQMRHLQALAAALVRRAHARARSARRSWPSSRARSPSDASRACLLDDDGVLRRVAGAGPERPRAPDGLRRARDRRARSFLVDDAARRTPRSRRVPLAGVAASPLFAERRIVGALVVGRRGQFSRYDRDDQRLLEVIAHLGGLACENLRLLGEQSTAMEAASGLASRFAACASVEDVVRVAVETISEHVRCDRAAVPARRDPEERAHGERLPRMLRVPRRDRRRVAPPAGERRRPSAGRRRDRLLGADRRRGDAAPRADRPVARARDRRPACRARGSAAAPDGAPARRDRQPGRPRRRHRRRRGGASGGSGSATAPSSSTSRTRPPA